MHDFDKTLELLAKDVLKEIKSFYSDSKNLKKFEEWKKREAHGVEEDRQLLIKQDGNLHSA